MSIATTETPTHFYVLDTMEAYNRAVEFQRSMRFYELELPVYSHLSNTGEVIAWTNLVTEKQLKKNRGEFDYQIVGQTSDPEEIKNAHEHWNISDPTKMMTAVLPQEVLENGRMNHLQNIAKKKYWHYMYNKELLGETNYFNTLYDIDVAEAQRRDAARFQLRK